MSAKHFLLLPPTPKITSYVKRPDNEGFLKNTSPIDFVLHGDLEAGDVASVNVTQGSPSQSYIDVIGKEAMSLILKEGEMLYLPERWWHHVQNIGSSKGWTAGVGYWFRSRQGSV